ncbi:tryptophan synthase beta subunit-like PLP-dependent enzyme [Terfezia boudieri ATCC MYA-4762]|uniref:L-serine ammonia-lyase n=1 Tax=Terfezia boudieri ATCC MYA-4762 TaxID=1051890 RepID=A0A3N4M0Y2_9PEZI|nr:tryptophan synthase beta subunit-like PLP-dependent enzyme [Terfezia boudieri ATCC MYA-4762]
MVYPENESEFTGLLGQSSQQPPWITTPLLYSKGLSDAAGCQVYMKLDNHQPSGSFKSRGVGNLCLKAFQSRSLAPSPSSPSSKPLKFYSSSGGNAGLAAVTAAHSLGCTCTVVVPETTTQLMMDKIRAAGGEVLQHGESWGEADEYLRALMKMEADTEEGVYCPPFDHEDIWEGNSTLINEVLTQLPPGPPPAALIASIGGGGLYLGLQLGLDAHSLSSTPIIAVEPAGAASLAYSLSHGGNTPFPKITSIATSLGARRVADRAYELASQRGNVRSVVLTEAQAAMGCVRFADEERMLVEAACGVSLAAVYGGYVRKVLPGVREKDRVVVVVCGGSAVSLEMLVRGVAFCYPEWESH